MDNGWYAVDIGGLFNMEEIGMEVGEMILSGMLGGVGVWFYLQVLGDWLKDEGTKYHPNQPL